MTSKIKGLKRIVAFVLAILLFVNALPEHMVMKVSAIAIDSYTIILEGMKEEENKEGLSVTLTNKDNEEQFKTVETDEDGKAVFEDNFVDSENSYYIEVAGRIGYADYECELVSEDITGNEYIIDLSTQPELEKVTLYGKVVDAEGNSISGAIVEYSAYDGRLTNKADEDNTPDVITDQDGEKNENPEIITDANGEYFFDVYIGVEYTISAQKEGYINTENETIKITALEGEEGNIEEDEDGKKSVKADELELEIKTYEVITEIVDLDSENPQGSISFKEGSSGIVNYGGKTTVTIKANENYKIKEIKVNDIVIEEGITKTDNQNWEYTLTDVQEDYKVSVSFLIKNYSVELNTNKDEWDDGKEWGTIAFTEDSSGNVNWGESSVIEIKANHGYKIKELKIGNEVVAKENIAEINEKEWLYELKQVKENKTVTAVFEKVFFDIEVNVTLGGKVTYNNTEIVYKDGVDSPTIQVQEGENSKFEVVADEGYHIAKLTLRSGETIETKIENGTNENRAYTLSFGEGVNKPYTIDVEFAINTYTITTKVDNTGWDGDEIWGTIVFAQGSSERVEWNGSSVVEIKANQGYKITELRIGNEVIAKESITVKNEKEWLYELKEIKENKTVTVEFEKLMFPIQFEYENGEIKHGEIFISTGGTVEIQEGEKPSFTVVANEGYHIEQVEITPTVKKVRNASIIIKPASEAENWSVLEEGSKGVISGTYTFQKGVFESYEVKVIFTVNTYEIEANVAEPQDGGSIIINNETLPNHGGQVDFTIAAKDGFRIANIIVKEIGVDGTESEIVNGTLESIAAELINEKANEYGNIIYSYRGAENVDQYVGIKGDVKITVSFEEVKASSKAWNEDIEFKSENMSIQQKEDVLYVYSKESEVKVAPKEVEATENSQRTNSGRINISTLSENKTSWLGWKEEYTINISEDVPTYDIQEIQITSNKIWEREKVNLKGAIKIAFDEIAPVINELAVKNTKNKIDDVFWITDSETTITVKATDSAIEEGVAGSGISHIVWSIGNGLETDDILAVDNDPEADSANGVGRVTIGEDGTYSIGVNLTETNEIVYYVYAVDEVNNISEVQVVNIKKDTSDPQIVEFNFKKDKKVEKDIQFEDYGTFSPEPITVTVTITDGESSAGLKKIELFNSEKAVSIAEGDDIKKESTESDKIETYTAEFTLDGKDFNGSAIYAKAIDNVGRESGKKKPTDKGVTTNAKSEKVTISNEKPEVKIEVPEAIYTREEQDKEKELWYASKIEFDVSTKTENENLGIKSFKITADKTITEPSEENSFVQVEPKVSLKGITASKEGKNVITANAVSNAGIVSEKEQTIYIDTHAPAITNFQIEKIDENKVLQFLTFGVFGNGKVKITVTADDSNKNELSAYSGVNTITLYGNGKKTLPVNENNQAVFTIPVEELQNNKKQFDKVISATATDYVGHTGEVVMPTEDNSNVENSGIMIETIKPTISLETKGIVYTDANKRNWCNKDIEYTLTVSDADSGIYGVEVTINDNKIFKNLKQDGKAINTDFSTTKTTEETFVISTSQAEINKDGSYEIVVKVTDNAGNVKDLTKTVYKDKDAPSIVDFTFKAKGYQEPNSEKLVARETDYGYYFVEDTEVTISATDVAPTSGIKNITYYTVDYADEKNPVTSKEKTVKVNANNEIKFEVKKDFKGQIYAKATDNTGNVPNKFVSPQAAIVESPALHKKTSSIQYTLPKTNYKDEKGNNLYKDDTKVKVEIVDSYSGIRQIDWRIIADYDDKQQAGVVTIDNDGKVTSTAEEGYSADCLGTWKATKERNIVTKLTNTILVSNDCNNIVIEFSLEDRAGNKTKKVRQKLSIDKTSSTIQVSMNDNDDEEFEGFFKEDRSAEITIHERNFNNKNVVFDVIRTDENDVQIKEDIAPQFAVTMENGKVKSFVDENGIEYYEYKMNYVFAQEGDYTFQISSKDKVNRENATVIYTNPVIDQAFTVDKTTPVIQVSYDNNAANGKYFKEARTATITVTEHNFEEARITYTRTSSKSGEAIEEPAVSSWTTNGNVHTATISYATDGDYTFEVTMNDKAGNADEGTNYGNSVAANEFTIDTTIEKPVIIGVENGKAYRDDVVLEISFADINFETDEITLLRTTKGNIEEDITAEFIEAYMQENADGTGKNGTMDIFGKDPKNDGIYTLSVEVADKAGNTDEDIRVFTLNRFGSVYTFGEYMTSLQEAYVQEVKDKLVITEYNPTPLVPGSRKIQITCDGAPIENIQSNLSPVENEYVEPGESGWYQYEYVIDTSNFEKDGLYKVFVSSEDEAGNKPEITNELGYDVMFHVDTTKPEITNISGLETVIKSPDEDLNVKFDIFDAIGLKNIKVRIDGEVVENIDKFEDLVSYSGTFALKSEGRQRIRLVVEDLAGNVTDTDSDFNLGDMFNDEITVTDNKLVRMLLEWYENYGFWGSVVSVAIVITGSVGAVAITYRRRKLKKK